MKKLLLSILALAVVAVVAQTVAEKANTKMRLDWDLSPAEDAVTAYKVYVQSANLESGTKTVTVSAPPVELTNLMAAFPNGEYSFYVTALGESGIESEPSEALVVFWYGNTPGRLNRPVVEFIR